MDGQYGRESSLATYFEVLFFYSSWYPKKPRRVNSPFFYFIQKMNVVEYKEQWTFRALYAKVNE